MVKSLEIESSEKQLRELESFKEKEAEKETLALSATT